jgi:hypothetical protein|uniref:DUF5668 domain-containing protein n=1 Tax=candidate division WOR-3 bacterium TaxID=2052148 RepID=A0A7V5Y111_UNCW3
MKKGLEYIFTGLILIVLGLTFSLRTLGIISGEDWWAYFLLGLGIVFFIDAFLRSLILKKRVIGRIIAGSILAVIGIGKILSLKEWFFYFLLILGLILVIIGALNISKKETI